MKIRNSIIIFIFIFLQPSIIFARPQDEALTIFQKEEMPYFLEWFYQAGISKEGNLELYATQLFVTSQNEKQGKIMQEVMAGWSGSLETKPAVKDAYITVVEPLGRSLWWYNIESDKVQLIERWDAKVPLRKGGLETKRSPWYFYSGGQFKFMENYKEFGLDLRVGTFLLKNRIDSALTLNYTYGEADNATKGDSVTIYGLLGRVHFPVAKNTTFNVGGHLKTGDEKSFDIVTGIGVYFSEGIFDVSYNYNTDDKNWALSLGWSKFL